MATLRDPLFNADLNQSADQQQAMEVANMGSLRRGWEAGRIGNELNPLYTEELDAGIAGDEPKRLSLRSRIDSLKQKQGVYAPEVGRVEDIDGVGSALSWGAGQVGQGVASMADPMAVSAGLGTAGRIAGAIPHPLAKGVGYAAQGAGMLIPALMSKQQLTGEFIGSAEQDAELMARTSPTALRDMAGDYGTLAAVPDSFLPGMVGRQVSGLSRAGSAAARQTAMGAGTKTALGMGMEGGTEALQSAGSQYALGELNPNRDTSGDFMENVNSFAGGAVGAGPFAAAGAYAEAGHNQVDGGVDAVKGAAGDVVDLLNQSPTVQAGVDGAKKLWGSAKDKTIDIMSDGDGKVSADALVKNLKEAGADLKSAGQAMMDERDVLMDMPPEDILADNAKATAWMNANAPKRAQLIADKLDAMGEDPQAMAMRDAMDNPDQKAQQQAVDAAAEFVLSRTPVGRATERANSLGESLGKIAGVVGPAIGKGIVATGKAALGFGKSVVSGAQDGMRKKNEQTSEPEGFMAWRDNYYGVTGQAIADKTVAEADPVVTQRADLAGNYVGDMARRLNKKAPNLELLARHAAFSLADIVMQTNAKGLGDKSVKLNRLADDLHGAFATETPEVLSQLASIMGPKAAPVFQYLEKEVAARMDKSGFKNQVALRDALASQVVALVAPEAQNNLLKQDVNLNTPRGREQLLGIMEDYADGIGSASGMRKALENTFGAESVQNILTLLNGQTQEKEADVLIDDRKQTGLGSNGEVDVNDEELSDFDKRAEEKNFAKGVGPKVYGFSKAPNLRTNSEKRDMFGAMDDADGDGAAKRPQLFEKGQKLFGGADAVEKKIADMKAELANDPDYPDHDNYRVEAKSAHDVMTEANMQPGKVLQLYRDYLMMDGNIEDAAKMSSLLKSVVQAKSGTATTNIKERAARKARARAWSEENPGKTVEDYKATVAAERTAALAGPVAEATKAAKEYFSSRYLVVGEQLSNQDPGQITLPEILNLHKEGTAALSKAKLDDSQAGEQTLQATSDANVLMFQDAKDPKKTYAIPAGKLVNWVRQQRGKAEQTSAEDTSGSFSNGSKDEAYLRDLVEGIATLTGSGYVSTAATESKTANLTAYKINAAGVKEYFGSVVDPTGNWTDKDGVRRRDLFPDSLRLATKTYGEMKFVTKSRREKRRARTNAELATVGSEEYDAEVAADQNRNDDFFTPDDRAERELVVDEKRTKPRRQMTEQRASDEGGDLVTREAGRGTSTKIRVDVSGQVVADAKTDDPSKTPMDFDKPQRDGVPDDYANQRWLSRQTGASTDASPGPEPKGTAVSSAEFRASKITDAFISDPAAGQEMIRMRVRMAMRPEYVSEEDAKGRPGKDQVVGGVHYIAPVAYFISAKNIGKNNLDILPATINAIQSRVAKLLLGGEVSKTEKVKMARLMFEGTDTKVTSMNVDAVLGRLAAGPVQGKAVVAKQEAAPGVANAGLPKGVATQSGASERKLNAQSDAYSRDNDIWMSAVQHAQTELNKAVDALYRAGKDAQGATLEADGFKVLGLSYHEQSGELTESGVMPDPKKLRALAEKHGMKNTLYFLDQAEGKTFNQQGGNARTASQADMDAAKNYALKVLGPKIKVDFKDITGYSGEFIDAQNVIEISTTAAAGTMGTLYHEAMHVFFRDFVKGNPRVQAVFESLINDPKHIAKLNSLLDGFPAAQAQLTSGEERLAYTYQFWKAGLLQVDTKAHTWLQKLGKFFRQVLGRVRDSERALELFQAFDNGKMSEPSAAGQVIAAAMNKGSNALKLRRQADGLIQRVAALTIPAAEILGKSSSPTARKLSTMLFTNPGDEEHGSQEIGMMNARRNVAQQYTNVSNRRFETMNEVDKAAVQKALQSGVDPASIADPEQRAAVKDIRHLLDRFHKYMTDSGMTIGKIDNYYPVVWNPNLLNDNRKEFIDMLATKYATELNAKDPYKAAERIWRSLVDKEGVDAHLPVGRDDGVLSPFFASQEQRTLPWLRAEDREKYLDKNMPLTLTRYFAQGAHATEYYRRFGKNGVRLEKMLADINVELSGISKEMMKRGELKDEPARVKWVARQMRDVSQSTGAMEGTLGKDVSPSMRTFNSWMAVYQNIRLLPMALFSSFVDPLALVARGAPLQAAYETFIYSMREVFRGWADAFKDMPPERQKDEWRQLSEHIGASEIAMFQHHVSDEYSSTYMTPGAKKLNDKMFTFNGMEAWNRGSRIMATKWAVRFIEKHSTLPDKNHSERWLKELGLQPSQIVMDDGKLVTSPQQLAVLKGISLDDARQRMAPIHDALNRWVEGAVLTPNAAQRPAWSSDPNYASFFHLKQFAYSFHQTILKRAANEFGHGNIAPLGALALFVPTMIGADIMKGLIQGAGSLPPYMAGMNAGDWLMHGVQRAGLAGIGVIGTEAGSDWASLGGPAFEQIIDAARDGFGSKTALKAMPVNSLYGQLVS